MSDISSEKILIACQGDANEKFFQEVKFLFQSLLKYGKKFKKSQKLACFVGTLTEEQKNELAKMDVMIKEIKTFDVRCIHANKIEVLNASSSLDFDLLLLLDTDIIISGDFSKYLDTSKFKAKLEGIDPIGIQTWKLIFDYFQLSFPPERFVTHQTRQTTIPFFCSAVIQIPKQFVIPLHDRWKKYVHEFLEHIEKLPSIGIFKYYIDEIALTLAIHDTKTPYDLFPLELNFSTHCTFHHDSNPDEIKPLLIHHHHRISKYGNPQLSPHKNLNKVIEKINLNMKRNKDPEIIIDDLYLKYLRRHGDREGIKHYSKILEEKHKTLDEIKHIILESTERKGIEMSDSVCLGNSPLSIDKLESIPSFKNYSNQTLLDLINISRKYFGWFTRHSLRMIEYPWIVKQFCEPSHKHFLDIGTGISPLPLYLAEKGGYVVTIDNSHIIRKTTDDPLSFNEWGFFDYSVFSNNIKSFNSDISKLQYPNNHFDCIYSVSVIEHIPSDIRKNIFVKIQELLKKNGILIITIDLIKNTDNLFNEDLYGIVDAVNHGNMTEFISDIQDLGFNLENSQIIRDIPNSSVDMSFMIFKKL